MLDIKNFNGNEIQEELTIYMKVLSWAHLNFDMQTALLQDNIEFDESLSENLKKIGYYGQNLKNITKDERENLFTGDGFFSATQTGNRIISYALVQVGLEKNLFKIAENGLIKAYENIKEEREINSLLDKTYRHAQNTLEVFT